MAGIVEFGQPCMRKTEGSGLPGRIAKKLRKKEEK